MSRKQNQDDGSLELLLDTICNTFGGVLFISILVVLLLNISSNEASTTPPNEAAQADLIEAEVRLALSIEELNRLMTAIQAQEQVAQQIVDPGLRDMVRNSSQLQRGVVEQTRQKVSGIDRMANDQIEINSKSQQILEHQESLKNAKGSLAGIEQRLQREIEARTQAAKLPKGRATQKTEIAMFLKAGHLCTYVKREGNQLVENLADIIKDQDDKGQFIEPNPGAGIVIHVEGDNAQVEARLNEFDPTEHYLAVFVWPDSFPQFAILKDRMVAQEFEYRLEPFQGNQKIYFGATEEPIEVQ
jgi:hypothetical protein